MRRQFTEWGVEGEPSRLSAHSIPVCMLIDSVHFSICPKLYLYLEIIHAQYANNESSEVCGHLLPVTYLI